MAVITDNLARGGVTVREFLDAEDSLRLVGVERLGHLGLPAGETKEITWHFTQPGTELIRCRQTGHYTAGVTGSITVGS